MTVPSREQLRLWMRAHPGSREFEATRLFVRCLEDRDAEYLWHLVHGDAVREIAVRSRRCERTIRIALARILRRAETFEGELAS